MEYYRDCDFCIIHNKSILVALFKGHVRCFAHALTLFEGNVTNVLKGKHICSFAKSNCKEMWKLAIQAGYDVNIKDPYLGYPLMDMASDGHDECMKKLMEAGADINIHDYEGKMALHHAAENGHEKCVKLLIEAQADINYCDNTGNTALQCAIEAEKTTCVNLLVQHEADINVADAVRAQLSEKLGELIQGGVDVNCTIQNQQTPLYGAVDINNKEYVKILIDAGADLNTFVDFKYLHETPLMCSARRGHYNCTQLLLLRKAQINLKNKQGYTALMLARTTQKLCNEKKCVKLLYASGEQYDGLLPLYMPDFLKARAGVRALKDICRQTIREHLLEIDENKNLFLRIPELHLPSSVNRYLLYNMVCHSENENEIDTDDDDGDSNIDRYVE